MTHIRKGKKNRGFTLGEMVTTVAIVGIISAIALPNFLRVKAGMRIEQTKQHLQKIGTHLNDLLNRDNVFPENLLNLGASDEEVAITGSLTAIDIIGYPIDRARYAVSPDRGNYTYRTDPSAAARSLGIDKCLSVDSLGEREVDCASLIGFTTRGQLGAPTGSMFQHILNDLNLTDEQKVAMLADFLNMLALEAGIYRGWDDLNGGSYYGGYSAGEGTLVSAWMTLLNDNKAAFEGLKPQITAELANRGIDIFMAERSPAELGQPENEASRRVSATGAQNPGKQPHYWWLNDQANSNAQLYEIAFRFEDQSKIRHDGWNTNPVSVRQTLSERINELSAMSADFQNAYYALFE